MRNMIDEAINYIRELFAENADGHGFEHAMRVYRNALLIAETEPEAEQPEAESTEQTAGPDAGEEQT